MISPVIEVYQTIINYIYTFEGQEKLDLDLKMTSSVLQKHNYDPLYSFCIQ